jgi:hypothetical protein
LGGTRVRSALETGVRLDSRSVGPDVSADVALCTRIDVRVEPVRSPLVSRIRANVVSRVRAVSTHVLGIDQCIRTRFEPHIRACVHACVDRPRIMSRVCCARVNPGVGARRGAAIRYAVGSRRIRAIRIACALHARPGGEIADAVGSEGAALRIARTPAAPGEAADRLSNIKPLALRVAQARATGARVSARCDAERGGRIGSQTLRVGGACAARASHTEGRPRVHHKALSVRRAGVGAFHESSEREGAGQCGQQLQQGGTPVRAASNATAMRDVWHSRMVSDRAIQEAFERRHDANVALESG